MNDCILKIGELFKEKVNLSALNQKLKEENNIFQEKYSQEVKQKEEQKYIIINLEEKLKNQVIISRKLNFR